MVKIYSAPNSFLIHNLKNILENNGIECIVQGDKRVMAMGELPPSECWTELWLVDHENSINAMKIINEALNEESKPKETAWVCNNCNEKIESQFSACWKCGEGRIGV